MIFAALALSFSFASYAQSADRTHEIGLSTTNFDNFDLIYRVGTESSLWRFSAFNLSAQLTPINAADDENENTRFGIGIGIGHEWRRNMTKKLDFRYGADLRASYNQSELATALNGTSTSKAVSTGAYAVLGINYRFSKRFLIGAEFLPGLSFASNEVKREGSPLIADSSNSTSALSFNMNNSAQISFVYQF